MDPSGRTGLRQISLDIAISSSGLTFWKSSAFRSAKNNLTYGQGTFDPFRIFLDGVEGFAIYKEVSFMVVMLSVHLDEPLLK